MTERMPSLRARQCISLSAIAALLGACVSSSPAPVETRDTSRPRPPVTSAIGTPNPVPGSVGGVAARPGYYTVKRGDTLYSIALENGHSYRDVAAWNNIQNPSQIAVGQELRVQPPESTAASAPPTSGTRPVILPRIESRPLDQSAPVAMQSGAMASSAASVSSPSSSINAGGMVTEPRGGRLPYSEKAWKDLLAGQSESRAPITETRPVPKPPVVSAAASAPAAAPAATAASAASSSMPAMADSAARASEDGVEWSWPSNGKVTGSFNDSSNKGLDIGGAIGDPVFAAAGGKIIYAGSALRGYGNLVIIQHAAQYTSVYAHNKEILVKEGQSVQKGQKIAVMGDSDADKPKLHFEVRKQGKPADPLKFLPTR